jgi:putative phosphoribosyl transferase
MIFKDRSEAGQMLAAQLAHIPHKENIAVIALPRGGVPVGYEIAKALGAPLDVLPVRKLGAPGNPELAIGAIAAGGVRVLDPDAVRHFRLTEDRIEALVAEKQVEIERQEELYRPYRSQLPMAGREAIVTDDGLATGWTMRAALRALRAQQAARLVVAVPVASAATCASLENDADQVICANTPAWFRAVGQWYGDFSQVSDAVILKLLEKSRQSFAQPS